MTREKALEYWKYKYDSAIMHNDIHYDTQECKQHEEYVKALEMAIKSLEAWNKVEADILGLDGYYDDAFWEGIYAVSKIIGKHLAEVEN